MEKEYERTHLIKGSNSGGPERRRSDKRPLEGPVERVGTYDPGGSLLCGRQHTEMNDSIEPVENEMVFC